MPLLSVEDREGTFVADVAIRKVKRGVASETTIRADSNIPLKPPVLTY
jgi:hypothetical protein